MTAYKASSGVAVLLFAPPKSRQPLALAQPERVVVINDYAKGGGGAAALARLSAEGLKAKGIDVVYFSGDAALQSEGIDAFALHEKPLLESKAFVKGLYNSRAASELARWIDQHDTPRTIYHLHNWSHILSPAVFTPLKKVRGRVVLSAHDFFLACPNGGFVHYGTNAPCGLEPLSAACLRSNCDKRSYAHKLWRSARQMVRNAVYDVAELAPRILTIHPAMHPYLQRSGISEPLMRALLNPVTPYHNGRIAAEDNRSILYVGRLDYEKGADLAAEAATKAGLSLVVIGDGPLRTELVARFPSVRFLGQQTKSEIAAHATKAAALVMPTRYPEPFGLVAVEALWSGLPVILPNTSFFADEIDRLDAGVLFTPGDADALAQAMKILIVDPERRHEMSLSAFHNTRHLANTPEVWLQELLLEYRDLLNPAQNQKNQETTQEGATYRVGAAP
ncbi:glycosyltransferase involved in cell wall biosynthesis [Rhizomicrobium palustre]|uniref:Glycosyltransferase involved in cell wall biosynthesis n=1 Tax=Rhizomicrobium palustre TaxID=189966 RepID=A0A846N3K2_9PROT|nr:glycosyltransferase family 4 protein [Rhizomicrobium palustre]NIK89831.1 glycosyltransferase involved in cell wall biosynthesis [Rhizomicrobium palustre]